MSDKYILVNGVPTPEPDLDKWASWFEKIGEGRRVAKTVVGNVEVSTVFLGLDHNFGEGPPILYETMVFGGPLDHEEDRYSTAEEAKKGHEAMVERVRGANGKETE